MGETRLRFPRLGVALDVTVEAGETQWRGRIVDLSPDAVKVRWPAEAAQLEPGANVRLQFALPDREFPFWVTASVARTSPESAVLWFVDLEDQQYQRLKDLMDSLLHREWQQVLDELVTPVPSGGGEAKSLATTPPKPEPVPEPARVTARATTPPKPEPVEEQAPKTAAVEASSSGSADPDEGPSQEFLARAGLNSLHFPGGGVLSPQWKEFLSGLGPKESPSGESTDKPTDKKWVRPRSKDTGRSKA